MSFVVTIIAVGIVIFCHELGHFIMAKKTGMGVDEFSVGMGPKLWSFTRQDTVFSLRLLPFGGFVKIAGMDGEDRSNNIQDSYYEKPYWARVSTILAGPVTNILLGFGLFWGIYVAMGVPQSSLVINTILPDSPAMAAALKSGDRIESINGVGVNSFEAFSDQFSKWISTNNSKEMNAKNTKETIEKETPQINESDKSKESGIVLSVRRGGDVREVWIQPAVVPNYAPTPIIGVQFESRMVQLSLMDGLNRARQETWHNIKLAVIGLKLLVTGQAKMNELAGPVGMIQFASQNLNAGVYHFLTIMAMINIGLGVINLLPFPVLDGGHLVIATIQSVSKRRLNRRLELLLLNSGAIILITAMIVIVGNDIKLWQSRQQEFNQLMNP